MEDYNRKLDMAKSDAFKKRSAPKNEDSSTLHYQRSNFNQVGMRKTSHRASHEAKLLKMREGSWRKTLLEGTKHVLQLWEG